MPLAEFLVGGGAAYAGVKAYKKQTKKKKVAQFLGTPKKSKNKRTCI